MTSTIAPQTADSILIAEIREKVSVLKAENAKPYQIAKYCHDRGTTLSYVQSLTPEALAYARFGLKVIPVNGKRPVGFNWQKNATNDPAAVKRLFGHTHDGIGVKLGEDSGIIDIECDDPEAEEKLNELFDGAIPRTPTFGSTRGKHRLFRWSGKLPCQDKAVFKIGNLEFRTGNGGKGAQTVFPPSGSRNWIVSLSECEIAEIPETVLAKLIEAMKPKPRKSAKASVSDADVKLKRARSYLEKVPGAVSGQGGHDHTFKTVLKTIAFGVTKSEALDLMSEWNQSCEPPWSESELEHKIDDAIKANPEPMPDRPRASDGNEQAGETENGEDDPTCISRPMGRTEVANARRFDRAYGDTFRYVHPWKKALIWDLSRWKVDDNGAAIRMATSITDQVWHELASCHTDETIKFAKESSKHSGIQSMIKIAGSMRSIDICELDANHWLLNCLNGTIDLRTGNLRAHQQRDNITKLVPTKFNPDASSYHWDRFLEAIFQNQQIIDFVQRLFGYFLTGDVNEQILTVLHGGGSNGKSTLLNAVQDTLGTDYSSMAPPSLLMEKKTESHPTELAGLFGQRLVIAQETNQGARLAESTVKQLTGGDIISARRMREDFWTFKPTHKLVLCTNHKPRVKGTDHAIWRRLVLIPFNQKFWNPATGETGPPELMQDKALSQKLAAEREGILAWMVRGCLEWQRLGDLQIPNEVRAATAEYRTENDTIGRFVADCCLVNSTMRAKFSDIYDALSKWCTDFGDSLPSRKIVGEWLRENRFEEKSSNGRWYLGIGVKSEVSQ